MFKLSFAVSFLVALATTIPAAEGATVYFRGEPHTFQASGGTTAPAPEPAPQPEPDLGDIPSNDGCSLSPMRANSALYLAPGVYRSTVSMRGAHNARVAENSELGGWHSIISYDANCQNQAGTEINFTDLTRSDHVTEMRLTERLVFAERNNVIPRYWTVDGEMFVELTVPRRAVYASRILRLMEFRLVR